MYGQGHHNGHGGFLGGGGHSGRFTMGVSSKPFQQHSHQTHRQQQEHNGHNAYVGHQPSSSNSGFGGPLGHFAGSRFGSGTPSQSSNPPGLPANEHWELQIKLHQESRQLIGSPHAHARNSNTNRSIPASSSQNASDNGQEERNRAVYKPDLDQQHWLEMDMGGQGLRALSEKLFRYGFLRKLYLNSNNIQTLPPSIGKLRNLEHLDLSQNQLIDLPSELGMLVNLKQLWLFDNPLRHLPDSLGSLHQLDVLGVADMPSLDQEQRDAIEFEGTKALITHLRENGLDDPGPASDREFHDLDESGSIATGSLESFCVLSFNILCDRYATQSQYGYTPRRILSWEYRRERILEELESRDDDILCLQEVDMKNFEEFFRPKLAHKDYRAFFWPKTRARTMSEKEARIVDGCAVFWRNRKFVLLDKAHIDFANTAINRPDMKGEHDIFNRVMPRDDIGIVVFLEHRASGARLMVANIHTYWNPIYEDVKIVQTAIFMDQITRFAEEWSKMPACKDKTPYRWSGPDSSEHGDNGQDKIVEPGPSMEYASGSQIPLIVCGDFNALPHSGTHKFLATGSLDGAHPDWKDHSYGNFTHDGISHPFPLKSAYSNIGEMKFTNYTPDFVGVIDYIWYTTTSLQVTGLLGDIDSEYMQRVPGFPNAHYPSDHLALEARFAVKARRDRRGPVEVDFGQ